MKKYFFVLLVFISLSFCGCKFFSNLFGGGDDEVTTTVETNPNSTVYLVKLNNSSSIIKGENTGYVTEVSRSAVDENKEYNDTDSFIRGLNSQINKSLADLAADSSRSIEMQRSVASGYSTTNYGSTETFWSYVETRGSGSSEVNISNQVTATKKYDGTYCYVYADNANSGKGINLSDKNYEDLGKKFDKEIYKLEKSIIGDPKYYNYNDKFFVSCNEKIVILVSDLFGDAKPNQDSGTVGYFYSGDLFKQSFLDNTEGLNKGLKTTDDNYIHSNGCEMFYIDAQFLKNMTNNVYSTLVHEFNHMINYVVKTVNYMTNKTSINSIRSCDTWFTEMLAMTTEDMFQNKLGLNDDASPKARLPYFGLGYYYGFNSWDNKSVDPLIMYANTYAFGAFLARNFGGVALIKEIAQNDYVNEAAITKALQTLYPNKGYDFTYALRKFTLCVVNTEYNSDFSLNRSTSLTNGLGFTAVNLQDTITYNGKQYSIPLIFRSDKDGQLDLYPYGFTVHYVDRNIKSFELLASTNESLEYYCVEK